MNLDLFKLKSLDLKLPFGYLKLSLRFPIAPGVQNLVTLAAMSQPSAAASATTPMCMAGLLGKGAAAAAAATGVERTAALTAGFQPSVASTSDLAGYGSSLFANVTLSAAARAAAGLEVEGERLGWVGGGFWGSAVDQVGF